MGDLVDVFPYETHWVDIFNCSGKKKTMKKLYPSNNRSHILLTNLGLWGIIGSPLSINCSASCYFQSTLESMVIMYY